MTGALETAREDTKCDVMQEGHARSILGHVMHHTGRAAEPM